jgi:hypothetical protein
MELNESYVPMMVANGDLVKGFTRTQETVNDARPDGTLIGTQGEKDFYHEKLFDICKSCKAKPGMPAQHPERQREERIQSKIRLLHEMRPDLSFEQRCHAAVEEEFDPKYEPNKAFREFLIERQGL